MKMDCPHCGKSLKGKLLRAKAAHDERRFVPNRAIQFCSSCRGELAINRHQMEKVQAMFLVTFAIPVLLQPAYSNPILMVFCAFLLVCGLSGMTYIHFKHLRKWQRFSRYVPRGR